MNTIREITRRNPQDEFKKWANEDDLLNFTFTPSPIPKPEHFNRTKFTEVVKTVWKEQVIGSLP